MQFVEELQEVLKDKAAVMQVGGLRKQPKDQNLATGHRQKPKGRIQAIHESQET
jgi:hypothetical protein